LQFEVVNYLHQRDLPHSSVGGRANAALIGGRVQMSVSRRRGHSGNAQHRRDREDHKDCANQPGSASKITRHLF
jgi:hypothetical protein